MFKQAIPAGVVVLIGCGFFAGCQGATSKKDDGEIVASFGDTKIAASELERRVGKQLFSLRTQEYELKERALREMAGEMLIAREAAKRGKSIQDLLKEEIEDKVVPPTPDEIRSHYEQVKARVKDRPEAEVLKQIEQGMLGQKREERREAFVRQLSDQAGLRVLLDPPRVKIAPVPAPSRGGENAPVTIVSFTDFQCPWCARAAQTIDKLVQHYGEKKIRIVFRYYPLAQIHPQAPKAAEAAGCAAEQGKFWEMHDKLFADQKNLSLPEIKKMAADIQLDQTIFDSCLDTGRRAADWQRDVAAGEELGITSTPTFFVNGRLVSGAQPFERFVEIVDGELARTEAPSSIP
jgi:protein-disulfide isomerase